MRKPFIAGNWKMFKTVKEAKAFAAEFKKLYTPSDVKVAIAAPFTQLESLVKAFKGTGIKVAAQNMHFEDEGAFTGEVSAPMLKELGVELCIIGHSERRQYFKETDASVNKKLKKALEYGIMPILCVGESLKTREAKKQNEFVEKQITADFKGLSKEDALKVTVAYEPIWAIGTGKTATPKEAQAMCAHIRKVLKKLYGEEISEEIVIQYGGSVKPANAEELLNQEDIDGALVGGASLKAQDFIEIVHF
ncbi:MAG: triose-phosphate isomerase [Clostridia bacterium]|nr:triose-phosphate isomerase [Clostridia bacterium]